MKIEYLGHSCFKLTESTGTSIVCDPYSDEIGYAMRKVSADAVTVSHGHYDHNAVQNVDGAPLLIDGGQNNGLAGVEINSIKSFHDTSRGKKTRREYNFQIPYGRNRRLSPRRFGREVLLRFNRNAFAR